MSIVNAKNYHTDQVHYLRKAISYTDDGTTVSVGFVPEGALIVGAGVVVTTAFNGGTTNTVDIGFRNAGDGTSDDTDDYATDLALGTVGVIVADAMATATGYHAEGAEIVAPVVSTASASAGAGYVYVEYLALNED